MTILAPPGFADSTDYATLRDVLVRQRFTVEGLAEVDITSVGGAKGGDDAAEPDDTDPRSVLVRLFLFHRAVPRAAAEAALAPLPIDRCLEAGVLTEAASGIQAAVMMTPYRGFYVAADWSAALGGVPHRHQVMGLSPSTESMVRLMNRRPVDRALDLGTGCGAVALAMTRHAKTVVATDSNPRAIQFTRFNARLNGDLSIDAREGDLFDPVDGESFGTIICNPPLLISPEDAVLYRDSGMAGDQFCETIVRTAPQFLSAGGFCQVLANWAQSSATHLRPPAWFEGSQCDVYILHTPLVSAAAYARQWSGVMNTGNTDQDNARVERWLDYYESHEIGGIGQGFVTLRRMGVVSPGWMRVEPVPPTLDDTAALHLVERFHAIDFLERTRDNLTFAAHRFELTEGTAWNQQELTLTRKHGLSHAFRLSARLRQLPELLDGRTTLGEVILELASLKKAALAEVKEPVCQLIRQWIESGLVQPASQPFS